MKASASIRRPKERALPGAVSGIGEHFPAQTLRVGIEKAERRGIARDRSAAVLDHDRPIATHMLCLLGSPTT